VILYKISTMCTACSARCSIQKHDRALSTNIIQGYVAVGYDFYCASTWMQGWSELPAAVRLPAMFIVVGDVQRGICVNACRVFLLSLIGLLNYDKWRWGRNNLNQLTWEDWGRSKKQIGVVPEVLANKERLKRQSGDPFFCPNKRKLN
jgi:hypothetical protein